MVNPVFWILGWYIYVLVWIGIYQGDGEYPYSDLLECYTPVPLAFDKVDPVDGADGSLPPIIFVHGTCSTRERWYQIPQDVADQTKRTVYNVDVSNHGDTAYNECFNYDIVAADILDFMEKQDIDKAVLVGYAMGGVAAIKAALWMPEKVEKLIVEEAVVTRIGDRQLDNLMNLINLFDETAARVPEGSDLDEANDFMNKELDGNPILTDAVGTSERKGNANVLITLMQKPDGQYTLKCNKEVINNALKSTYTTMSDNVGTYDGPALFIYGTAAPNPVDGDKDAIEDRFPNAQLMPIEGANRQLHAIYQKEFSQALIQFIMS